MKERLPINNLKDMLKNTYCLWKDNVAYKIKEKGSYITYTHQEVTDIINYLGTALINMGLEDKNIAIIGDNSMNWEISYLAVVCGVGVVVPIDKTLPRSELERIIKCANVSAVFTFDKKYEELKEIAQSKNNALNYVFSLETQGININNLIEIGKGLVNSNDIRYLNKKIKPEDKASMLFTSGTTSQPKVVILSHENICANLFDLSLRMNIDSNDVFLSVLPVHHAFECTFGFLLPIYKGACITFNDGLRHIVDNLREYKVSVMACVPALYEIILKSINRNIEKKGLSEEYHKKIINDYPFLKRKELFKEVHEMLGNNIKYLISGAAYLNEDIERGFRDYGINLMQGYGLTETSPVISMCADNNYRFGSVGKALNSVEVKIINPNAEEIGELVVKGKSVMSGYYLNNSYDRSSFKNGYFYTGDLAKIDSEGYIYICGRKKDTIVLKNGKNIYPEEIEYLINKVDGVKESLIYSLTEEKSEVKINAKIVFDRSVMQKYYNASSDKDIYKVLFNEIKKINKTIPEYKTIKGIVLTEKPLIRTSTNKIKRQENINVVNMA